MSLAPPASTCSHDYVAETSRPRFDGDQPPEFWILAELAPAESEVHGLVALMEIQASRMRARIGPSGEPVVLLEQNRALWDHLLIRRGLTAINLPSSGSRRSCRRPETPVRARYRRPADPTR